MPGSMDERVVSMEFDNKQFEKNVKTSMKTLDDLKESLDFDKSADSLDELDKKFKKFGKNNAFEDVDKSCLNLRKSMGLLGNTAGNLVSQFAQVTKITAMFELAEQAVHRLQNAIKQFTIQPIAQGFEKYTTKINSIKTIANATGMAAEAVDQSLDRLNWFTDETSASFDSMVQNIGKFTSVGKGLDESITAMQGIAAWGYHSGASIAEQNRAMYNLSQALGTGSVKLIDWKSIENAGMATKEFKEQAIAAAEAAGTLKRKGDKLFTAVGKGKGEEVTFENFNSTLAKGWFTSDVLMDTLKEYGSFADKVRKYQEEHPQYALASEAMAAMDEERIAKHDKLYGELTTLIQGAQDETKELSEDTEKQIDLTSQQFDTLARIKKEMDSKNGKETLDDAIRWDQEIEKLSEDANVSVTSIRAMMKYYDEFLAVRAEQDTGKRSKLVDALSKKTGVSAYDINNLAFNKEIVDNAEYQKWYEQYLKQLDNETNKVTNEIKKDAKSAKMSSSEIKKRVAEINKIADKTARDKAIKEFSKTTGISVEKLTKLLDGLAETEESLGEKAFKSSQQAKSFSEAIDATKDAVSTGWMKTFQYIFGGLDKSIELWSDVTEILWDLFAAGAEFRNNAFMHWAEEFNGWADLWNADPEKGPIGALRNIMNTVIDLKSELSSSFKDVFFPQLARITGTIYGQEDAMTMTKNGLKTTDQLKQWREGNFMGSQLKQMTSNIRKFTASINEFFTNEQNLEKIRNIFTAIATAVRFAVNTLGSFFGSIGDFVKKSGIFQDILNVLSKVATKVTEVFNKLQASGFIQKLFGRISDGFVWFYNLVKGWIKQIREFFDETGIGQTIKDWFNGIIEFFTGSEKDVDKNGKRTESGFFRAFGWLQNIKEWFEKIDLKSVLYDIKTVVENFGTIWTTFVQGLNGTEVTKDQFKQGGVSDRLAGILESISSFGNKLSGVWETVKGAFESVVGWLESSGILPAIRDFGDTIKTIFDNIGTIWEVFTRILSGEDPFKVMMKYMTTASTGSAKMSKFQKMLLGIAEFAKKLRGVYTTFKGWFGKALAWIGEKWKLFTDWLESSGILPAIRNAWEKVKMFFTNIGLIWKTFTEGFKYGANTKDQFKQGGISDGLAGMLEGISNFGVKIRGIVDKVKGAWDKVKNWFETSGILPTLRSWWSGITEWFENVKKDIESNGVFSAVSDFFTGLWEKITGLFGGIGGGGNAPEMPKLAGPAGKKEPGFFDNFIEAFTTDGHFDLIKGISTGIAGIFETIGAIDWTGISTNFFGILVKVVNGFDDALGELHYQNIIRVMSDILGAFSWMTWAATFMSLFSTIRSIVKKGKDKSVLEQFTDLLAALGQALLQIGIAVALIAGSMWLISQISPERFRDAAITMGVIGAFLIGFLIVATMIGKKTGAANKTLAEKYKAIGAMFVSLGVAVALIAASMLVLSMMSTESLIKGGLAVVAILGVMTLVLLAMSKLSKDSGTLKLAGSLATFAGLAILIGALTVCILLLQRVEIGRAFVSALLLSGFLLAIAGALKIMDKIKIGAKTIGTMIILGLLLGIVTASLILLRDMDLGKMAGTVGIIAGVLAALIGATFWLARVPDSAITGAAKFAAVLAILVGVVSLLAVVVSLAAGTVMNNLVSVMSSLATASISAKLVDKDAIANALDTVVIIAKGLANVASGIDPNPAMALADAAWRVFNRLKLASMSARLVEKEQFTKIFGEDGTGGLLHIIQTALNGITDTGWKAASLGTHVEQLSESLKLVGQAGLMLNQQLDDYGKQTYTQGIQNVKDRLTDIQEIVQLATTMGSTGSGEDVKQIDLTQFSEGIANIGAALQLYNQALASFQNGGSNGADTIGKTDVAPLSTENISAALQSVMSALRGVTFDEGEIGAIEGWAGLASGGEGGTLFALGLTNIANAMGTFSTAAKDFDNDNVKNAVASLGTLADIQAKITNPAQYKSTIDGITSWGDSGSPDHQGSFANAISSMGTAMAAFGQSVKNIPSDSVTNATNALDTLATIYEKLNGKENMVSGITGTMKTWFGDVDFAVEMADRSSSSTFHDFSEGIGFLGDALAAFSAALTNEDYNYDEKKVQTATSILESMVTMQKSLVEMEPGQGWFDKMLFGENGFKKLGDNISGLGARLATFANELTGASEEGKAFNIDIDSDQWKNVSGVLTYMVGLATELNNLTYYTQEVSETGQTLSSNMNAGYTLEDLAKGIGSIVDAVLDFNLKMTALNATTDGSGTFYLGQWSAENFENIKTMLETFKNISIDLKNAELKEGSFYDLDQFAFDVREFFNDIYGSNMLNLMGQLPDGSDKTVTNFATFIGSMKSLAEAAGTLHGMEVNSEDVEHLISMFSSAVGIAGGALADELITGFAFRVSQESAESGASDTLSSAMEAVLSILDSYSESFFERGKTAGQRYAAGFKEGMNEVSGFLTPVVSMDNQGNTSGNGAEGSTSLASILTAMNYVKVTDISAAVTNIQSMKDKLNGTIKVDDGHASVLNTMKDRLGDLDNIKKDVDSIKAKVNKFAVYIYPNDLVGAIVDDMDRALGDASRVGGP